METRFWIGQQWRHIRGDQVITIGSPKLDTADEWYVREGTNLRVMTTAQIIEHYRPYRSGSDW